MSAVSSVKTRGVLVTMMLSLFAAARSMLSTPLPKLAMSLNSGFARARTLALMRSVTVGTRTCADSTAAPRPSWEKGSSVWLSLVSNIAVKRASMSSGSFRVTITVKSLRVMNAGLRRYVARCAGVFV